MSQRKAKRRHDLGDVRGEIAKFKEGASKLPPWVWFAIGGTGLVMLVLQQKSTSAGSKLAEGGWSWVSRPSTKDIRDPVIWNAPVANIQSDMSNRSAFRLNNVIDQFSVKTNPRYAIRRVSATDTKESTFCNIFTQDVMRALGLELPWGNANALAAWFYSGDASLRGWKRVSQADALKQANAGYPTVASWQNPNPLNAGHVAVVRPANTLSIAQAGATNFNLGSLVSGFGKYAPDVTFFTHA